jgi:hypothetical protein
MSQYAAAGVPGSAQQAAYGAGYAAAGAGAGAALGAGLASSRTDLSSDGGDVDGVRRGPSTGSTLTSAGFAGRGTGNAYYGTGGDTQMPTPVPTGGSSSTTHDNVYGGTATPSTAASRKMREAQQERLRNMYAQNDHANNEDGAPTTAPASPSAETTATVPRLAEDGGRYVPEGEEELPPQSVWCGVGVDYLLLTLDLTQVPLNPGRSSLIALNRRSIQWHHVYEQFLFSPTSLHLYLCVKLRSLSPSFSLVHASLESRLVSFYEIRNPERHINIVTTWQEPCENDPSQLDLERPKTE